MKRIYILFALYSLISCNKQGTREPANIEYFKNGQILYPDYAIPDTLIVMDADGLNRAIAPIEQGLSPDFASDSEISNLFYKYCLTK